MQIGDLVKATYTEKVKIGVVFMMQGEGSGSYNNYLYSVRWFDDLTTQTCWYDELELISEPDKKCP